MIHKPYMKIIGFSAIVLFLVLTVSFVLYNTRTRPKPIETPPQNEKPIAIPTVSADVTVQLVSVQPKKELKLVVGGVPSGTKTIEYELTYSTKEQASEGVFSSARPNKGESVFSPNFERQITLGTCSRNVCRYHEITSDITVRLRFEGSYGAQIFERGFPVDSLYSEK